MQIIGDIIELGFIHDPLAGIVAILAGLIGFLYAGERFLDRIPVIGLKVNTEDKQTRFFKYLSIFLGFLTFGTALLLVVDSLAIIGTNVHTLTIVLFVVYGLIVLAHPIRDLEGWKIFAVFIPLILGLVAAISFLRDEPFSLFGIITLPLWFILGGLTILLFIIFALIFFSEETMVDPLLGIIGWAPFVGILSFLLLLHGALLFIDPYSAGGRGLAELIQVFDSP